MLEVLRNPLMVEIVRKNMRGRMWQNLIHRKCPDCDSRMQTNKAGFGCPEVDCGFFITRNKLAEVLTDPTHAAVRYLNSHEHVILEKALAEIGIVPSNDWRAPAVKV